MIHAETSFPQPWEPVIRAENGFPQLWETVIRADTGFPQLWEPVIRAENGFPQPWEPVIRAENGFPQLWEPAIRAETGFPRLWEAGVRGDHAFRRPSAPVLTNARCRARLPGPGRRVRGKGRRVRPAHEEAEGGREGARRGAGRHGCCPLCRSRYFRREGDVLGEERRIPESLVAFNRSLEEGEGHLEDDDYGRLYYLRGISYHFAGEHDRALADAGRTLELLSLESPKGFFADTLACLAVFIGGGDLGDGLDREAVAVALDRAQLRCRGSWLRDDNLRTARAALGRCVRERPNLGEDHRRGLAEIERVLVRAPEDAFREIGAFRRSFVAPVPGRLGERIGPQ